MFLTPDAVAKVEKLYAAYQEHPALTASLAEETAVAGGAGAGGGGAYMRTHLLSGTHPELDATMYLEHRGRLAILKAAVDYLLAGGAVHVS